MPFKSAGPDFLKNIINTVDDGIYCVDTERRITFWNKAAERITGYSAEEMIGKACFNSHLEHIDKKGRPLCDLLCPLVETIFDGKTRQEQVLLRHKEGHRVPIILNTYPIEEDGVTVGAMEIFKDSLPPVSDGVFITALAESMMHDEMTGLPNRTYLNNFILYKLRENKQFLHSFVLLFADIDNLKIIRREYGITSADNAIRKLAKILMTKARRNDLIGRWSSTEIVGVFSGATAEDEYIIGEKFRSWVYETRKELPESNALEVSIGLTAVRSSDSIDTIISRADRNMFYSKTSGHSSITTDEENLYE